ncbi:MAG: hypothetical protein Q8L81_07605, partial [Bacteroidota bacterium]|nr:hypothetical protein [Bacteroidota bacterium]
MEDNSNRQIKSGREYDRFFPKATGEVVVIKRFAKLEDTIKFLPQAIKKTLHQTKLIAKELAGGSEYEVAKRVWQFAFDHISYRKDEPGKEQIQSPQYTWAVRAGDCDDFTVFICSILYNLKIKVFLRIAMYTAEGGYQHIYPVSILIGDKELPLDCVARRFNYEVPYIKKIDKNMELQFLNGIPEDRSVNKSQSIDADDLLEGYEGDDIGELGKGKLKAKVQAAVKKVQATKVAAKVQNTVKKVQTAKITQKVQNVVKKVANSKVVQAVKKGVHAVNRVNPAAALLRVGVLTALKTNLLKVAENLRFSYLSPAQVQAQNFDPAKISRLTAIRERLEKIFFGAGGKIENFKASILTGKGNRDKQVAGLGAIDYNDYTQQNHVRQILGIETYNSEIGQVEGLEGLGVVTSAAVAAATSAMSAIAALIKSIG